MRNRINIWSDFNTHHFSKKKSDRGNFWTGIGEWSCAWDRNDRYFERPFLNSSLNNSDGWKRSKMAAVQIRDKSNQINQLRQLSKNDSQRTYTRFLFH